MYSETMPLRLNTLDASNQLDRTIPQSLTTLEESNRLAINLIQLGGYHDEAVGVLRRALDQFQTSIRKEEYSIDESSCPQSSFLEPLRSVDLSLFKRAPVESSSPHNHFNLFDRAFLLPRSSRIIKGLPHALRTETACILLFNSGIAVHRKAHIEGGNTRLLQSALRFYLAAVTLLRNTEELPTRTALLWMALNMNMCHIHSHLWQTEEMEKAHDDAAETLDYISSSGLEDYCVSDEEHTFFTANFTLPLTTLAPSA